MLILKIIFFLKKIISIYLNMKGYLKNNHNYKMTEFYRSKQNIEEFYINIHCQPINPH